MKIFPLLLSFERGLRKIYILTSGQRQINVDVKVFPKFCFSDRQNDYENGVIFFKR